MRIISGNWKGKKLFYKEIDGTKPTSDMVKQVILDVIGNINNKTFLDLFAGSGSVGIEALSRGAKHVVFVDNNAACEYIIKKNINALNVNNYAIIKKDYLQALTEFDRKKIKFDYIFIDPPYNSIFAENALFFLKKSKIIDKNTIIIWEHNVDKLQYDVEKEYQIIKRKHQGIKYLTFLQLK